MESDLTISEVQSLAFQFFEDPQVVGLVFGGGAGGGKGLALDTKILTTNGWTTMGDLKKGDRVFDKDGNPTEVVLVSKIHHRPCYRVNFSDDSFLIADDEHRWLTFSDSERRALLRRTKEYRDRRRSARKSRAKQTTSIARLIALADLNAKTAIKHTKSAPKGTVRSTEHMFNSQKIRNRSNYSVPVTKALQYPYSQLKLAPYVLGAWLGDGYTKTSKNYAKICSGLGDADELFKYLGEHVQIEELRATDSLRTVRFVNLVPHRKYIPREYLESSMEQRLELLKGLMDTDGHACAAGSVEFTTILPELADNFAELVRSLGWRCTIRVGDATLNGKVVSKKYRIKFSPDKPVFKLSRKKNRQKEPTIRTHWKYITSIEKVESVPTKCIMVDSPSKTYLAGETLTVTHNTFLLGLIAAIACKKYPGTRWGLARKELKSLKQTTLATLISKVHPSLGITENDYKLNLLDSTLEYVNGSSLLLLDLTAKPSDPEMESLGSLELTGAFIDEVGEVNKKPYDILASRVNRWLNKEYGITGKVVSSCNPSPSFVRQEFYDKYSQLGGGRVQKWQNGHVWVNGERLPAYNAYIRSTVLDNPFVDENYVESLRRLPPLEKRRLLDGNWDYADEDGVLFSTALIDKMTVYEIPEPEKTRSGENKFSKFIGVDPSDAGKDDTVLTLVENGVIAEQVEIPSPKGKDDVISLYIANKIVAYAQRHGFTPALAKNITIEGNGVGAALRDSLRSLGWRINVYTAGASTRNDGYYQFMIDAEEGKIKLLNTVIEQGHLIRQLSAHKYDMDTGKPKVTNKKELRRTLGRSPDHADSAMIANMAANKFKPKNISAFIRW